MIPDARMIDFYDRHVSRMISEKYGLWVWLCNDCHTDLHFRHAEVKMELREQGQITAQRHYGWNDADFRMRFGKCYK